MSPAGNPRDQKFMLTFTSEERDALTKMAQDDGLPAATWLRQLMLKEYRRRETGGELAGRAKKKR
jgi:hypothetical protein